MKSATAWMDAPNPGPHCSVGLNAQLTRDAEAIYNASKMEYLSQLNVTQAIINALNIAVPKEFKRGTNAAGTIMGASPYRNNNNPRAILRALRTLYGRPTPAEKQANNALFCAPWNPADPIETYFDRLEDCFVTAIIATPPYTMAQMMDMAIMTLQITGLYSQALTEWESKLPIDQTWDALKSHFATAYNLRLISGTTTAGHAGYHSASNVVENDDTLNNIEQTLNLRKLRAVRQHAGAFGERQQVFKPTGVTRCGDFRRRQSAMISKQPCNGLKQSLRICRLGYLISG
jgi:hypothetical protein